MGVAAAGVVNCDAKKPAEFRDGRDENDADRPCARESEPAEAFMALYALYTDVCPGIVDGRGIPLFRDGEALSPLTALSSGLAVGSCGTGAVEIFRPWILAGITSSGSFSSSSAYGFFTGSCVDEERDDMESDRLGSVVEALSAVSVSVVEAGVELSSSGSSSSPMSCSPSVEPVMLLTVAAGETAFGVACSRDAGSGRRRGSMVTPAEGKDVNDAERLWCDSVGESSG